MTITVVHLPPNCTFKHWRAEAKKLIHHGVPPHKLEWYSPSGKPDLFANPEDLTQHPTIESESESGPIYGSDNTRFVDTPELMVPAEFVRQSKLAICHVSDDKYGLLYRILWRLLHDEPHLLDMEMDADIRLLGIYCKAVRRDLHKMTAFVRFDRMHTSDDVTTDQASGIISAADSNTVSAEPVYYSWFEPEHNILARAGDFFMKRFSNTCWSIATPIGSVCWDKVSLIIDYTPIEKKTDVHDGVVALWDTYYASTFNPGRLKLKAMHAEMPRKYWSNMPETRQISALASNAPTRKRSMLAAEPSDPPRWAKRALPNPASNKAK